MQTLENLITQERKARSQSNAMRQAYYHETDPKTATKLLLKRVELAEKTDKAVDAIALFAIGKPAYRKQNAPCTLLQSAIYPLTKFNYAY